MAAGEEAEGSLLKSLAEPEPELLKDMVSCTIHQLFLQHLQGANSGTCIIHMLSLRQKLLNPIVHWRSKERMWNPRPQAPTLPSASLNCKGCRRPIYYELPQFQILIVHGQANNIPGTNPWATH
jgi:hypothetical protein